MVGLVTGWMTPLFYIVESKHLIIYHKQLTCYLCRCIKCCMNKSAKEELWSTCCNESMKHEKHGTWQHFHHKLYWRGLLFCHIHNQNNASPPLIGTEFFFDTHSLLWPSFQCFTWHSLPQYRAALHRMHCFNVSVEKISSHLPQHAQDWFTSSSIAYRVHHISGLSFGFFTAQRFARPKENFWDAVMSRRDALHANAFVLK